VLCWRSCTATWSSSKQEALQAQSASIQVVSGATGTSYAFAQSLQGAILHAKKA
jgi:uncharacterized protein with FMN-binding domain